MGIDRIKALPCWTGDFHASPMSGGLSNEIWKVTDAKGDHVVRFGADYPFHHVDRAREAMSARAAHAAGFAPEVEYTGDGVMVTAFIPARTWTPENMRAAPERVAKLLRDFHHEMPARISGTSHLFWVFHVIRDYARTLERAQSRHAPDLSRYLALGAQMEAQQIALPIIFGHGDLLPANILDDGKRLWLIDYEYAGFSTAMFDLAGAASNAAMPPAQSQTLLTAYFQITPTPALIRAFDAMQVASLLREAMWGMVSEIHLNAPGVDYAAYTTDTLAQLDAALARFRATHGESPT